MFCQDLKHVFPASRLLISTVTTELTDLKRGYATFKRLVEGDPNLRPNPPEPSPKKGNPPSPAGRNSSASSSTGSMSGSGADSEAGSDVAPGMRSEKLKSLSRQKTENRTSVATTGKVRRKGKGSARVVAREGGWVGGW